MTDAASPDIERGVRRVAFVALVIAAVISVLVGTGAGILMASITPTDKFSWLTLLLIPVYIILEGALEISVAVVGSYSRIARVTVMVALIAGFYVAWFHFRPL